MEDYEELMLQISDVMREANRVIPDLSHEQAIKNIRGIVERHGKWVESDVPESMLSKCSVCGYQLGAHSFKYCPICGARMDL